MSKPDDLPAVLRAIRINGMPLIYAEEAADEIEQLRTERDDLRREWQAEQHVVEVLRAENAALKADAERYRWLKNTDVIASYVISVDPFTWDEAIDAARGAKE